MIEEFLNKRWSLRKLSDVDFEKHLPQLASELSSVDFVPRYTEEVLLRDWKMLQAWAGTGTHINSTSRLGIRLCEHFFPNFWDIEDRNGVSFRKLWGDSSLLEKVIRWNRKCHSTPYLSELRRGVYFCSGLSKSTMYRPQVARLVTNGAERVLDPCMGWGGRLLGSVASGAEYVGFDPNTETFAHLNELVEFLGVGSRVHLICDDALHMDSYDLGKFDVALTSPPYFDLEVYSSENTQSIKGRNTYEEWESGFLKPLIRKTIAHLKPGGKSCWNVAKVRNHDMWESVHSAHFDVDFLQTGEYGVRSSARQVNQDANRNRKTVDMTVVYCRENSG
jgi:hypothetical protein